LIVSLFSVPVLRPRDVFIDVQIIIDAIDKHLLDHGIDDIPTFDPKNNKLELMINNVRSEQGRCIQDLVMFNTKLQQFQQAFTVSTDISSIISNQFISLNKTVKSVEN